MPAAVSICPPAPADRAPLREPARRAGVPWRAWVAFAVGLTNPFTLPLVGLMPVSEVVLLAGGACFLLQVVLTHQWDAPLTRGQPFRWLMACQAVALFGYMISDVWRGSSPPDIARGWARMGFLAFDVACLAVLFGEMRAFVCYQLGVVCSGGHVLVHGALFDDYWKFGFGVPCTVLGLLTLPLAGPVAGCLGVLGLAALHWVMDYRSMALVCVLVAAMQGLTLFPVAWRRWLFTLGIAATLGLAVFAGQFAGESSERSRRSNAERTAMLSAASEAFYVSPLIGQGSWFSRSNVMNRFVEIRAENARAAGVGGFGDDDGETMAIHSQLLVGLAEGGLLGGSFFVAYGVFLVWALGYCALARPWSRLTAILLFVLVAGLLNLCFTPFSGAARVDIAAAVGVLLFLWRERQSRAAPDGPRAAAAVNWPRSATTETPDEVETTDN